MKRYGIRLSKECTFEASHCIPSHPKCGNLHGHSYRVGISITGVYSTNKGMLVDFGEISRLVEKLDHSFLNNRFKFPSAENLAIYLALKVMRLNKNIQSVTVTVYETENACATYTAIKKEGLNETY